jgi:hypothetical protein
MAALLLDRLPGQQRSAKPEPAQTPILQQVPQELGMKRHILSVATATMIAFGASAAWAQPGQDSGGGKPGGTSSGPASGGGGGSTSGSSGSDGVSSGSSSGGSSMGSASSGPSASSNPAWGDTRSGGFGPRADAPRRAPGAAYSDDGGQARARGGSSSGGNGGEGRATPRGSSSGGDSGSQGRAVPRGEGGASGRGTTLTQDGGGRSADSPQGRQRQPVPEYSRPRDGRTPVGTPVERTNQTGIRILNGNSGYYYDPYYSFGYRGSYYSRYNGWYPGYGFGLGYFYDPFMTGFGDYGYGSYGGGYYGGGGGGYYRSRGYDTGSLRLKVAPRDGKVYVDGYFVGVVDSFDGAFQKLAVEAGTHRIEIRADGFEPAQFEIMVTPGETITYKGELKRSTQ